MLLRDLQNLLGTVYGLELNADVCDFLVTDAALLRSLEDSAASREIEEKLLIQHGEDELGLALYLDGGLLERLAAADPRDLLCGRNLADFCTVIEGVSHFNYVAWNAAKDKSVTLLELEMQAEIDKYIGARILLERQDGSDIEHRLFEHLFDDPMFHDALGPEELERYREACRLATRFCHSLQQRFPERRLAPGMVQELRAFYRLPQPAKISHIQSAIFS